jgi:mannobiose 2-epimerase
MDYYKRKKRISAISVTYTFLLFFFGVTFVKNQTVNNAEIDKDTLLVEVQKILDNEFKLFYPLSIDTLYGGFFSDINYKWELDGRQNKMIVTQARHIWSTANAALFYNNNEMTRIAEHGFKFLKNKMWDQKFGGFYDLVNRKGEPLNENGKIIKRAYGNAFAIYGLAAYYKASGDTGALKLARETFNWLEKNSYDSLFGGYFQFLSRDGKPFREGFENVPPKDQNSSIHLLEAFTELYSVWPDKKLKERLTSLQQIIRDTITTDKGYMNLFFKRDWTPVLNGEYEIDHVSFGHDVETAYLLLEASDVLGIENDTNTLEAAKRMVDHALQNGWDEEYGGLYNGGYYYDIKQKQASIINNEKEWWSQAEALNSFLMMSELFPNDKKYYEKFLFLWDYTKKYLIDNENGGWFWGGIDKAPNHKFTPKVTIWKCNYHTSRSLINCIKRLTEKK